MADNVTPEPEGSGIDWTDPNKKFYAFGSTPPKPGPFTFEYDATTGVLIAAALREKADAEDAEAEELETMAFGGGPGATMHDMQANQARNRARVLRRTADTIQEPVHAALVADFDTAFKKQGL